MPRERNHFPRGAVLQSAPPTCAVNQGATPVPPAAARQAFVAFQAQKPDLLAQGLQGQWALFHGDRCIQVSCHRDALERRVEQEGYHDEDFFIDMIMPEPDAFEEECLLSR